MEDPSEGHAATAAIAPLTIDECLERLSSSSLGRVAFIVDGEPAILPVNYVLHEGCVVFRTTYGTTLDSISAGTRVAFETDGIDAAEQTGWSVIVRGKGEEIWLAEELAAARALSLHSWAPGERTHFVRILPAAITGRRITRPGGETR